MAEAVVATMGEKEAKAPSSGASAVSDAPVKKNRQVKRKPRSQRGGGGGVRNKQNPKMTTVKHGTKGGKGPNNRRKGGNNGSGISKKKKAGGKQQLTPMSKLRLGTKIDGVVAGISSFGVFIKTNYAIRSEGDTDKTNSGYALLHKSQVQDEKVEDISKIFKKGDKIKGARVISINYVKGEVSLSLRKPRPKRIPYDDINVGKEYDGKIANVTPYGAFVDIGSKKNVLLHISRMTQDKVTNVRDYVSEGDIVTIHIIEKNDKTKTLSGSMLDRTSDEYLNKRKKQMQRQKDNHKEAVQSSSERSELEFFEEAIRELEEAVKL